MATQNAATKARPPFQKGEAGALASVAEGALPATLKLERQAKSDLHNIMLQIENLQLQFQNAMGQLHAKQREWAAEVAPVLGVAVQTLMEKYEINHQTGDCKLKQEATPPGATPSA